MEHPKWWRAAWFASICTVVYWTTYTKAAYNSILSNMGRKNLVFKVSPQIRPCRLFFSVV